MKALSFIFLIFAITATISNAQDRTFSGDNSGLVAVGVPNEIIDSINEFFETVSKDKVDDAYNDLLSNSPIRDKKEQIDNLKLQTRRSINLYGDISGAEIVNSEVATPSYIRVRYLAKHKEMPMRWIFTWYNAPEDGWVIVNIRLDDLADSFFTD